MATLHGIKPERVWYYFEEISKIPRCSGNEKGIRDFIVQFAEDHGLNYKVDKTGNVVVIKGHSPGYKDKPGVILQAHLDMVCEKNRDAEHDFNNDPIKLKIKDGRVCADGTTLGADNGIGVSAMLALLENNELEHGKVECLFTVEEETGLKGAMGLGEDMITGRYMINLDSEESGTIYIGCAGGVESKILIDSELDGLENGSWRFYMISITGLKGGHSGGDIDKERANAIKLMGRLLFKIRKHTPLKLVSVTGGDKHNAIPRECFAILSSKLNKNEINKIVEDFNRTITDEYKGIEGQIDINTSEKTKNYKVLSESLTNRVIDIMLSIPHGVIRMSRIFENLVETSTNFAAINVDQNRVEFYMSHRSSVESSLENVMDMHAAISNLGGGKIVFLNRYPAWQPDTHSKLLELSALAFKNVHGKKPEIKVIHAGLESAIIKNKFENMDIISIGPTIENPHSPMESVEIKTVNLFWKTLLEILKLIN